VAVPIAHDIVIKKNKKKELASAKTTATEKK